MVLLGFLFFNLEFFGSTYLPSISAFGSFKNDFQKDPDLLRLNELDEFPLMRLSAKCLIQQQRFQSQKVLFGRFLETLRS